MSNAQPIQEFARDLSAVLFKHKAVLEGYSNFHTTLFPVQVRLPGMAPISIGYAGAKTSHELERLTKGKKL